LAVRVGGDRVGHLFGVPGSVAFFSARDGNNEIYVTDWDVVDR
jgi:hypothetical protein